MILVSGCLLGINCKYNGDSNLSQKILDKLKNEAIIPFCPEQLGGLSTPRPPVEIQGGDGSDVLEGRARVVSRDGCDVTKEFLRGAQETLKMVELLGITHAVLKARSPSCGVEEIYDGNFTSTTTRGDGVTAALLKKSGVKVDTEDSFEINN